MINLIKSLFLLITLALLSNQSYAQQKVEQWDRFEVSLKHNHVGNSFIDVNLSATFTSRDTSFVIAGFYDGNNVFKIRFMPQQVGIWNYTTSSNIPELNNHRGTFECAKATGNNHGMVRVSDTYNFKHSDGKRYYPFGTTVYGWIHANEGTQKSTLNELKNSGFNKVRMNVFPNGQRKIKLFPFEQKEVKRDTSGKEKILWNYEKFVPEYFQHLEKRIDDLCALGIEADIILFHPYDDGKWGFDAMPMDVNIRYLKYITARLSSFRNVWWSMANEFDYLKARSRADWDLLSKTVVESDPYRHLCSIHGSTATYYEYWKPMFTHVSIQDNAPVENFANAALLRNVYKKPIIYDEVNYEGNFRMRWGQLSGEEMLHSVWQGVIAGTYVTHGECYVFAEDDTAFFSQGSVLKGTSWKRIAFLRKLVEECPGPLELADISRDHKTATAGDGYYIIYFGREINSEWLFNLPAKNSRFNELSAGKKFKVEIIDTWDMTIQAHPATFETTEVKDYRVYDKKMKKVRLPLKPYIVLRITEIAKINRSVNE